ncbi:MFS transporter [Williamsia sp.]|uniref:MFS transporter n=1 Tax=Williamsia sp. TaxID=1872085 RepID=UPI002F94E4B7
MPSTQTPDSTESAAAGVGPVRAWGAVVALAVAVFVVTATEMLPVGVLPEMAADLGVSDGAAGQSVTVYGFVAGVFAPLMTSWTGRADRRVLLLWIVGVFAAGNAATALVPSYEGLLAIRVGIGMVHGLMWSITAAIAVRLVSARSAARATAAVFSGISLALVLGVPAGSVLGSWAGWRVAFGVLAAATVLAWCVVFVLVPAMAPRGALRLGQLRSLLLRRNAIGALLTVTALVVVGNYAAYTYIAPILLGRGAAGSSVGAYLLVYGVSGVVGNAGAALLLSPTRSVRMVLIAPVAVVGGSLAVLAVPGTGAVAAVAVVVVWGAAYSVIPVVLQTLVLRLVPHAHEAASSLYVMVFNIAIGVGALLGAVGIAAAGPSGPAVVGVVLCGAAIIVCAVAGRRFRSVG